MKRRFRPWALPALLLCTGALAAPPSPTEIRIAESFDTPTSMPGHRSRNTLTDGIMLHVVESLVALKSDLGVGPMLADSWTISPDGKTYRFKLRHGVRFHNGAPVTSAEVIWSLNRIMDPRAESYCRNQYDGSKGAKVVAARADAPDAVTIELDRPNALFLQQLANIQCPLAVLHPDSVDAAGKWLRPIGTGPYMFGQWRRGQFVQLLAWPGYQPRPEPPDGLAQSPECLRAVQGRWSRRRLQGYAREGRRRYRQVRRGFQGLLTHWHSTGHSRLDVRAPPANVMHRSRSRAILKRVIPCLRSVNMTRLIQMTKGAPEGPFLMKPLVNNFTKAFNVCPGNGVTDKHGLA